MQNKKVWIIVYQYGAIYFHDEHIEPSINWLNKFKERFKHIIWLNPILKDDWATSYGSWTLNKIREVIHMEDLTLNGIKKAVEYLNK